MYKALSEINKAKVLERAETLLESEIELSNEKEKIS